MIFRTPISIPQVEQTTTWYIVGYLGGGVELIVDPAGNVTSEAEWCRPLQDGPWLVGIDEEPHLLRWLVGV